MQDNKREIQTLIQMVETVEEMLEKIPPHRQNPGTELKESLKKSKRLLTIIFGSDNIEEIKKRFPNFQRS